MRKIEKHIIQKRFERGKKSYKIEALLQQQIAKQLVQYLLNYKPIQTERVLEIGCGTGFLTDELLNNFKPEHMVINDMVDAMRIDIEQITSRHNYSNWEYVAGDAEKLNFSGTFNMIVSSATVQWFHQLDVFFQKVHQMLEPNGVFAFTTFGPDNFKEIKATLGVGLHYHTLQELETMMNKDWEIIMSKEEHCPLYFHSPIEVLRHMQRTGVNALGIKTLTPSGLKHFQDEYKQHFSTQDNKLSLTYHPISIIARKKE